MRDLRVKKLVLAVLGPTASGKSSLGIALARRFGGEIVNCDSTAVYRGFDIGTDKVPVAARAGIPHHLIDVADPTDLYTAARFATDATHAIREIHARGRVPILVGGTGLYYRALVRGLFPGPAADQGLRARLTRVAERRGDPRLHRMLGAVDPVAAERIAPADRKKVVRALEVYLTTGKPLTTHFLHTASPIADCSVHAVGLALPVDTIVSRVATRVEAQFERGIVQEVRQLLALGVPRQARPFGGLVYRQVMELLDGVRGEAETRALIVTANRQYARRQLIWFRKEPNLRWFDGPGEAPAVAGQVIAACASVVEETNARLRGYRG
ncbi:MAG TPA: tRNA (adenosine(37)-N6)-dimethylallyltransferase MiaA [Vicinamibacterales bacterium]